jgi:hypothetical protein
MKNKKTLKGNLKPRKKSNKSNKPNKKKYRGGEQPIKTIIVNDVPYSYNVELNINGNIINQNYYGRYSGDWFDGRPFKEGKFVLDNTNNFYEGSWGDGKPNGFGEFVTNLKMYSGEFLHGNIQGTGIMELFNTSVMVEGSFEVCIRNNIPKICINGVATYSDGSKFIGQFVNNEKISGHAEPAGVDNLANNVNYNIEFGMIHHDHDEEPTSVADLPFF